MLNFWGPWYSSSSAPTKPLVPSTYPILQPGSPLLPRSVPPHPTPQISLVTAFLLPSSPPPLRPHGILTTGDPRVITPVSWAFPLCHLLQHQRSDPPASQSLLRFPPPRTPHRTSPPGLQRAETCLLFVLSPCTPQGNYGEISILLWNTLWEPLTHVLLCLAYASSEFGVHQVPSDRMMH